MGARSGDCNESEEDEGSSLSLSLSLLSKLALIGVHENVPFLSKPWRIGFESVISLQIGFSSFGKPGIRGKDCGRGGRELGMNNGAAVKCPRASEGDA